MSIRVLYHLPMPRPRVPECDAIAQEVEALKTRFGGESIYLHPSEYTQWRLPRLFFGLRELRALLKRETNIDAHHIYNPDPYPFPYLRFLKKPIVYTVAAGMRNQRRFAFSFFSRTITYTIVSDETDLQTLRSYGLGNGRSVPTGIDQSRFRFEPNALGQTLILMYASAPWDVSQFRSKGIDTLLDTLARVSALRLVFLWRGHLFEEMKQRVQQRQVNERVEIHNEVVDVNRVLARVHATIVLADDAKLIRAYPHSLLESLAAGRPVLVSRGIPLAEWVEREECGVVIERVESGAVEYALKQLRANYQRLQQNARRVGQRTFSLESMLDSYGRLYRGIGVRAI